jgi:dihydroorotate dehydrogenase
MAGSAIVKQCYPRLAGSMRRGITAFYRALYHGLLCRLPEPSAIALGQATLRALPLDRFPVFSLNHPDLAVSVGGVRLANPLILAAMYYDPVILRRAMGLGFGAVTTKSITVNPRPGHPRPNLVRVASAAGPGFVNCNGFHNPGLEAFLRDLRAIPHRVPLIVSVAGESIEDYVRLVGALAPHADLIEFNVSSPNTRLVYEWSRRPGELARLFASVRAASSKPLIVKLSPDFAETNERDIIPAALAVGIRIVNYGNARRVEEPRLSQGAGGLSGPEIFPVTLENLRRTRARFGGDLDIIATGGVDTAERALALLGSGATAVGYFTGFVTQGPLLARQILERLLAERRRG